MSQSHIFDAGDSSFNLRIIIAAFGAIVIAILIAFYYSYLQFQAKLKYMEDEKKLLVKDLTFMRAEVDNLRGLSELAEIDLQDSKFKIEQLLDSVGKLNFTIGKLKEDQKKLQKLTISYDSLKRKNGFLRNSNVLLAQKNEDYLREIARLKEMKQDFKIPQSQSAKKTVPLTKELKAKSFLSVENAGGKGFRLRDGRPIQTNKASTIEKLRGCVKILGNPNDAEDVKVIYLQFLDPEMRIIEDNATSVKVGGNTYSKRHEIIYLGKDIDICAAISVPVGSLYEGIYTLNVFQEDRLLASTEFQLK